MRARVCVYVCVFVCVNIKSDNDVDIVEVYTSVDCTGISIEVPVSNTENRCSNCWDACNDYFPSGTEANGAVHSIKISSGYVAKSYSTCSGTWAYDDPGYLATHLAGCRTIAGSAAHFTFEAHDENVHGPIIIPPPPPPPPASVQVYVRKEAHNVSCGCFGLFGLAAWGGGGAQKGLEKARYQ